FQPGNKAGRQFTSTNQPTKAGRKKALYKQLAIIVNKEVSLQFSKEDFIRLQHWLLEQTKAQLFEIYQNEEMPMFILMLIRAILEDVKNGSILTFDRVIGKTAIPLQVDQIIENNYVHYDFKNLSDDDFSKFEEIMEKVTEIQEPS
ncbi:MAG TPA: hypothetical protein P5084_01260, partial [Paludibacter sp.]|nr:hypothetical protein [Paludibacter sp.]